MLDQRRRRWISIDRAIERLAACVLGSNPAETSFSMRLGDHVNGGLVELRLRAVYRR